MKSLYITFTKVNYFELYINPSFLIINFVFLPSVTFLLRLYLEKGLEIENLFIGACTKKNPQEQVTQDGYTPINTLIFFRGRIRFNYVCPTG